MAEREIARFPTQQGGTSEPTFARELSKVFDRAEKEAKALDDQSEKRQDAHSRKQFSSSAAATPSS